MDTERAQADPDGRWRAILDRARLGGRAAPPDEAPYPPSQDAIRLPRRAVPPSQSNPGYAPAPPAHGHAAPPAHGRAASGVPGQVGPDDRFRTAAPNPHDPATQLLRRNLGGPRVLAFANPKGGVHKTTATVLAAATIGSVRGRGVLAWDDNELRGTLGLRAGSARHARTIRHLISELLEVENSARRRAGRPARRLPAARLGRLLRRARRRGEPALRPAARPAHGAPGAGAAAPHPRRDLRGHRQQRGERQLADRAADRRPAGGHHGAARGRRVHRRLDARPARRRPAWASWSPTR